MWLWEKERNKKLLSLLEEGRVDEAKEILKKEDDILNFNILDVVAEKGMAFSGGKLLARDKKEEEQADDQIFVKVDQDSPFGLSIDAKKSLVPLVKYLLMELLSERQNNALNNTIEMRRVSSLAEEVSKLEKEVEEKTKEIEQLKKLDMNLKLDGEKIKRPKKKEKLIFEWNKKENDFMVHFPSRPDGSLVYSQFSTPRYCQVSKQYKQSFIKELEKRGYNLKTLKFSVEIDAKELDKKFDHLKDE